MVLAPQAASRLPRIPLNCEGKVRGSRPPKEKINTMASDDYEADNRTPAGQLRSMGQVHGISERVPRMGGLALRQRRRAVQCDYQYPGVTCSTTSEPSLFCRQTRNPICLPNIFCKFAL